MLHWGALAAAILLGVAGQLALKGGAGAPGDSYLAQMLRPQTIGGLALYVLSALCYIVALRKIPVSVAFPSVSLSYALVALAGHWLYQEPFGLMQLAGLVLIAGGVALIAQG